MSHLQPPHDKEVIARLNKPIEPSGTASSSSSSSPDHLDRPSKTGEPIDSLPKFKPAARGGHIRTTSRDISAGIRGLPTASSTDPKLQAIQQTMKASSLPIPSDAFRRELIEQTSTLRLLKLDDDGDEDLDNLSSSSSDESNGAENKKNKLDTPLKSRSAAHGRKEGGKWNLKALLFSAKKTEERGSKTKRSSSRDRSKTKDPKQSSSASGRARSSTNKSTDSNGGDDKHSPEKASDDERSKKSGGLFRRKGAATGAGATSGGGTTSGPNTSGGLTGLGSTSGTPRVKGAQAGDPQKQIEAAFSAWAGPSASSKSSAAAQKKSAGRLSSMLGVSGSLSIRKEKERTVLAQTQGATFTRDPSGTWSHKAAKGFTDGASDGDPTDDSSSAVASLPSSSSTELPTRLPPVNLPINFRSIPPPVAPLPPPLLPPPRPERRLPLRFTPSPPSEPLIGSVATAATDLSDADLPTQSADDPSSASTLSLTDTDTVHSQPGDGGHPASSMSTSHLPQAEDRDRDPLLILLSESKVISPRSRSAPALLSDTQIIVDPSALTVHLPVVDCSKAPLPPPIRLPPSRSPSPSPSVPPPPPQDETLSLSPQQKITTVLETTTEIVVATPAEVTTAEIELNKITDTTTLAENVEQASQSVSALDLSLLQMPANNPTEEERLAEEAEEREALRQLQGLGIDFSAEHLTQSITTEATLATTKTADDHREQAEVDALSVLLGYGADNATSGEHTLSTDISTPVLSTSDDTGDMHGLVALDSMARSSYADPEESEADALQALRGFTDSVDESEADALSFLKGLSEQEEPEAKENDEQQEEALSLLQMAVLASEGTQISGLSDKLECLLPNPSEVEAAEAARKFELDPEIGFSLKGKVLEIVKELGSGATATVWKGMIDGCVVALKQFELENMENKKRRELRKSLKIEVDMMREHTHPNILRYFGSFYSSKTMELNVVIEFVSAGDVTGRIKSGPLNEVASAHIIFQTLQGLAFLHAKSIMHRDIKPDNLLLDFDGTVKLADFGIAAQLEDSAEKRMSSVGTPWYTAPEVINGEEYSFTCDVWSLGCTLFELITARPPYADANPMIAVYKMTENLHPPLPPNCSSLCQQFLLCCWARGDARPSARDLLYHPWIINNLVRGRETTVFRS